MPNNSFKPNLLRYTNNMAEKACHVVASATQVGLTQALDLLMKTLVVPPAAQRDENSIQMLSAWIAEKGLHCSLNIGMWEESGRTESSAWGILLADSVRHIANALQEQYGHAAPDTVASVLEAMHKELGQPTSSVQGDFHHGHS